MSLEFEFKNEENNNKRAVLLFHGMTGSPYEMKKYGQFLNSMGYDVYCDCLPGHGDKVDEIYTVTYKDWLNYAYSRFKELKSVYNEVYLSGLCLGAVLALAVAEEFPNDVSGIIALSTTLFLDGWRLPWYKIFIPIGLSSIIRFYYTYPECEPHGVKNERTRAVIKKLIEKSEVSMMDFPMTCIFELLKLSAHVRKYDRLNRIVAPLLLIHSEEDDLTSPKSASIVYENISSQDKNLIILNDSYHMVLYDNEKEFVFNSAVEFLNSHSKLKECVAC